MVGSSLACEMLRCYSLVGSSASEWPMAHAKVRREPPCTKVCTRHFVELCGIVPCASFVGANEFKMCAVTYRWSTPDSRKHAEYSRNMPIEVATLKQALNILTQIFGRVTSLLQLIGHPLLQDSVPRTPLSDGLSPYDSGAQIAPLCKRGTC